VCLNIKCSKLTQDTVYMGNCGGNDFGFCKSGGNHRKCLIQANNHLLLNKDLMP
jgi:hypothetical protein